MRLFAILCLFGLTAVTLLGWDWDDRPIWSDGGIPLHIKLGSHITYSDGNTPNDLGLAAAAGWNSVMSRVQFLTDTGTTAPEGIENGYNTVSFSSTIVGEVWPRGVLAVAISFEDGTRRTEADVLVNASETWDSYNGSLRREATDLLRVLYHELGHTLGLDHPDEAGQSVDAIMNAYVGDRAVLSFDDLDAIGVFYGYTETNPGRKPDIIQDLPSEVTLTEFDTLSLGVGARGRGPLSYQWFKNNTPIDGAAGPVFQIDYITSGNAATYHVNVTNLHGTRSSTSTAVTVTPAQPPIIISESPNLTLAVGEDGVFNLEANSANEIVYQWYKDGVPILANGPQLNISRATFAHAGSYHCVVTNFVGSTTSRTFQLEMHPSAPSDMTSLNNTLNKTLSGPSDEDSVYVTLDNHPNPRTFQWYRDGIPLTGANSGNLQVTGTAAAGHEYFALVSNGFGSSSTPTFRFSYEPQSHAPPAYWLDQMTHGGIVYFLLSNPTRVERYQLSTQAWLSAILLGSSANAFSVYEEKLYVMEGNILKVYNTAGEVLETSTELPNSSAEILATSHGIFIAPPSDRWAPNKKAYIIPHNNLNDHSYFVDGNYLARGFVYRDTDRKLYALSEDIQFSPGLHTVAWDDSQTVKHRAYIGYGAYPNMVGITRLSPDQNLLAASFGEIYDTRNDNRIAFIDACDALAWSANNEIVTANSGQLRIYDSNFRRMRWISIPYNVHHLEVSQGKALAFIGDSNRSARPSVLSYDIASAQAFTPAETISPVGRDLFPHQVLVDRDGIHLIYSKVYQQVFRWNPTNNTWLSSVPLRGAPNSVSYSETQHVLYLGYADGSITKIAFTGTGAEEPFTQGPPNSLVIAAGGANLLVASSRSESVSIFDANGVATELRLGGYSHAYTWSNSQTRFYSLRDRISPNDLLFKEVNSQGLVTSSGDSPYHGHFKFDHPIALSVDERFIALGSGEIFSSGDLTHVATFGLKSKMLLWIGADLYALRKFDTHAEIVRYSGPSFSEVGALTISGTVSHLVSNRDNTLTAYSASNGNFVRTVVSANLEIRATYSTRNAPFVIVGAPAGAPSPPNPSVDIPTFPAPISNYLAPPQPPANPNAIPLVPPVVTKLVNLSTRVELSPDQVLVAGFVIGGTDAVTALVRAVGPELEQFGVSNSLPNPKLTIYNVERDIVAQNDDWSAVGPIDTETLEAQATALGAFPLTAGGLDAAVMVSLPPGAYTAHVEGTTDDGGVVLLEVYDGSDASNGGNLVNLSTRSFAGSGAATLTAGFVVAGEDAQRMLVRAVGPSLEPFGVTGVLSDPVLSVRTTNSEIAANDNWGGDAVVQNVAATVGAFPFVSDESRDAALVHELEPGQYTAQVQSAAAGETGEALIEVYQADN